MNSSSRSMAKAVEIQYNGRMCLDEVLALENHDDG